MSILYLMCGVPGAGKTTFIEKNAEKEDVVITRDAIRLSLLKEGENYFSHEKEVRKLVWDKATEALRNGHDVIVDQTSLTVGSRRIALQNIKGYDKVILVWIDEDLDTCLERNELRKGTSAYVPRGVIRRMYYHFDEPTLEEGFSLIYKYKKGDDAVVNYLANF